MTMKPITLKSFYHAKKRIQHYAARTPLIFSPALSEKTGKHIYLKIESLQPIGAFKLRGAANALLCLSEEEKKKGVIAFSTGNHGRAVAYMAGLMGIDAYIVLSERVPVFRVEAMEKLGATVVRHGASQDDAYAYALELKKEKGLTMIPPFDDPAIIAGQGTIGIEIMEDLPQVDTVVVPLSGGGLMAGISFVMKKMDKKIHMYGVSMESAPAMHASLTFGKPVEIEEKDSLADALLGGIGLDNKYTFPMVRDLVDEVILVSEEEIAEGMRHCLEKERCVIEGSGAVGVSALLSGKLKVRGENAVVVLSGGNVDMPVLKSVVCG